MNMQRAERAVDTAAEALRDAVAEYTRALRELDRAALIREEEPEVGAMLHIEVTYPSSEKTYTYLAINTDSGWYVTGQGGATTWDKIVSRVERGEYTITEFEIHLDGTDTLF